MEKTDIITCLKKRKKDQKNIKKIISRLKNRCRHTNKGAF